MDHAHSFGFSPSVPFPREGARSFFGDGRLINFWLLVVLTAGLLIVTADGLTKPFDNDWEFTAEVVLSHKVTPAAGAFAAIMLPLVLLYARRARASTQEGVLLWFLLCTMTYSKDFAYLQIPGLPLYISDYVLGWLLLRQFVWPRLRWFRLRSTPVFSILVLIGIGCVAALRGLAGGAQVVLVFRDLAMVVYGLFLIVGIVMIRDWKSIGRVLCVLVTGAIFMSVNALAWLLNTPGQRRYIVQNGAGQLVLMCLVLVLVATLNRLVPRLVGWSACLALTLGVLLANSRALDVSLAGIIAILVLFGPSTGHTTLRARFKAVAASVVTGVLVLAALVQTAPGAALVGRAAEELVSGVVYSQDDPQAQFRLLAWAEAMARFAKNPIIGEGYGLPFTFENFEEDPRPHNTYLTFLYKTGVTGFVALIVVLARFFLRGWTAVRTFRDMREAGLLYALLLGLLAVFIAGNFSFVFESPYLASVVWLTMAIGYRMGWLLAVPGRLIVSGQV